MSVFDPKEMVVLLNGREITEFGEKGNAIEFTPGVPAGTYTMGVTGKGVFINDPDKSGSLVLNMAQHSADNKWLNTQKQTQRESIRSFVPFTLEIKDLLNEDVVTAQKGYFTELPGFMRGTNVNNTRWMIVFETHSMALEKGFGN